MVGLVLDLVAVEPAAVEEHHLEDLEEPLQEVDLEVEQAAVVEAVEVLPALFPVELHRASAVEVQRAGQVLHLLRLVLLVGPVPAAAVVPVEVPGRAAFPVVLLHQEVAEAAFPGPEQLLPEA